LDREQTEVDVSTTATLGEVAEALRTSGSRGDSPWVEVLIGDPDADHPLDPVRLRWGDGDGIDLWRMRAEQSEWYARGDRRAHNGALAAWRDGRFLLAHPSDTSESAPLDIPLLASQNRLLGGSAREGVLTILTDDLSVPARPVLTEARRALEVVHYLVWYIAAE
jgi:hypothetical protein